MSVVHRTFDKEKDKEPVCSERRRKLITCGVITRSLHKWEAIRNSQTVAGLRKQELEAKVAKPTT